MILRISAPALLALSPLRLGWDLFFHDVRPPKSALAASVRFETYEILMTGRPIRNRMLMSVGATDLLAKESIMLDVAFVALGCAVLALMGVYAHALRQL